jgi:DNA-binding NarL/FixJ family response regulator
MVELYRRAVKKDLDIQYEIADTLATIAKELELFEEAVEWIGKVQEFRIISEKTKHRLEITKIEVAYELNKFENERTLLKEKSRQLVTELAVKSRETEILAIQLAKKGSFLASLNHYLSSLKKESEPYSQETIDKVIKYIDSVRHKDKEFERLEEHANALHNDFLLELSERYPGLTETERKICLLFRLGLATNDVANVLFASVRTVETHCLSIRKKMKIPQNIRIAAFIRTMKS